MGSYATFSAREWQVIKQLAEGAAVKDIALELNLSANTVKDYLKTAYQKAQVHSARELLSKVYLGPEVQHISSMPARLLQAIEGLYGAREDEEFVGALLEGARLATGAQRASLWTIRRLYPQVMLVPRGKCEPRYTLDSALLRRIATRGYGRISPSNTELRLEHRRICRTLGTAGSILGIHLRFGSRVLLLVSDDRAAGFEDWAVTALRVLGRVAEAECAGLVQD
jgi:DNA-binding CsgD family transcriptional regulator